MLVVLPSIMLVWLLVIPMGGGFGANFIDLVKDLGIVAIGLAVYGAVFAFIGAKFKRPLLVGLVFVFGWEQAVLMFPGYLKQFRWPITCRACPPRHAERWRRQHVAGPLQADPVPLDQPGVPGPDFNGFPVFCGLDRRKAGICPGTIMEVLGFGPGLGDSGVIIEKRAELAAPKSRIDA
jgi:hypothetical protein